MPPGTYDVKAAIDPRYADSAASESKASVSVIPFRSLEQLPWPNRIANPSFESGTKGWAIGTPAHLDPAGHTGGALRVDKADFSATSFYHVAAIGIPLEANVAYVYGAWMKTQPRSLVAQLMAKSNSSGPILDQPRPPATNDAVNEGTGDWILRVGQIPAQHLPAAESLTLLIPNFSQGSVWLDDVFLIPIYTTRLSN